MFFPLIFGGTSLEEATAFGWAESGAPYFWFRSFDINTGIGSGLSGASPAAAGEGKGIAFSPTGGAVGLGETGSPYLIAYPFSGSTGITGAKYADPADIVDGATNRVCFSREGDYIAASSNVAPYIYVYPWSDATGFGSRVSSPAVEPPNTANESDFNHLTTSDALAVAHFTSPYLTVYSWNGTFVSKYANPSSLPSTNAGTVSWHPDNDAIAIGTSLPEAYDWDAGVGFGTKFSVPSGVAGTDYPNTGVTGISFSPTGGGVAAASISTSNGVLWGWPWSHASGWGTVWSNPDPNQGSNAWAVNFTPSARAVIFSLNPELDTLYPQLYEWDDSTGFGTRYSPPSPTISGLGGDVAFNGRI